MRRLRLAGPARADLREILKVSRERWGEPGRARYAALVSAALAEIASNPLGASTRNRPEAHAGARSFHLRHVRGEHGVKAPVHVVYYRADEEVVSILRILHERMDVAGHLSAPRRRPRR